MTPDTGSYLLLGLGVTLAVHAVMIGSMLLRYIDAQKDLQTFSALVDEKDKR